MTEAIGATGGRKQRLRIPCSLKLNRLLYFPFTTLWAVAYYISFFRNPAYLWLIAIAVTLDAMRLSPRASSQLYAIIITKRYAILGIAAILFVLHCFLVVSDTFPGVAFALPYSHYRAVLGLTSKFYAAIIYCLEAFGAPAAFLVIAYYGVQMATVQAASFLEQTNRALRKYNARVVLRKLIWVFVIAYTLQLSVGMITIDIHGRPRSYRRILVELCAEVGDGMKG